MATEDARKLFVAGLPDSITEDVLRQLFEATGSTVVNVSLPKDRSTGRPRGFGFVTLASADEASRARQALDGSIQAGRSISVRPFSSEPPRRVEGRPEGAPIQRPGPSAPGPGPSPPGDDRTLYVGNLPYDTTQQEIEQLFQGNGAGQVVRIHLPMGPDGKPRGFGFVSLASNDAANQAIAALRNAEVRGRRLMINIAHPRGERPAGAPGAGPDRRGPRPPGADMRGPRPGLDGDGPSMSPMAESARPVEGRRARGAVPDLKRKKKERPRNAEGYDEGKKRGRGGGNSWQNWDEVEDDWDKEKDKSKDAETETQAETETETQAEAETETQAEAETQAETEKD